MRCISSWRFVGARKPSQTGAHGDGAAGHTILYTDRWAETVAFYRDSLSLTIAFENEWFVEFVVGPGSFISIADAARSSIAPAHGDGITLSFQVDDVHAARSDLIKAGVKTGDVGVRWGVDVVDVHDPSGNRLEFWAERTVDRS